LCNRIEYYPDPSHYDPTRRNTVEHFPQEQQEHATEIQIPEELQEHATGTRNPQEQQEHAIETEGF